MIVGLSLYEAYRYVWDHLESTVAWCHYSDLVRARSQVISRYL